MSKENPKARRNTTVIWLLIAVCIAPVAASYLAYYVWQPSGHVNYGELIEPRRLPDAGFTLADGMPFGWQQLKGRWVLVTADSGRCDAHCYQKLIYLRQIRLAQGKEMDRVERVWLITDAVNPKAEIIARFEGTMMIRAAAGRLLDSFPAHGSLADDIYLIDPLGNLMMRYPREADPRRIVKDIERLLKISRIG